MRFLCLLITSATMLAMVSGADARTKRMTDANGNSASGCQVVSKTGAKATVGCAHVAKFQAYIDDLENNHGAKLYFLGGTRRGRCWSGSMHPCGKALDTCQLKRGVVHSKCRLPDRSSLAVIASRHGLFEGGQWCHSDYGHAQVGVSAEACNSRTVSAKKKLKYATAR